MNEVGASVTCSSNGPMRGVVNLFIRQAKSDDFITVGIDADFCSGTAVV
jgi:hypothetical protein